MAADVTATLARAGLAIAVIVMVFTIAAFVFLWVKVRNLEERLRKLMGETAIESGVIFPRRQNKDKTHKTVTVMDLGRISGYESASESVILEDNVVVANGQRRASLHGKTKFICQVYRTAQSYFSDQTTQTDVKSRQPSIDDITIETFSDNQVDPGRSLSVNIDRYSHRSGREPDDTNCRKQMMTTKSIDSWGGQLEISGVTLTIPAGALKQIVDISLGLTWDETKRPTLTKEQAMLSPVIVCQPRDVEFLKPVQLSFPHSAVNALSDWTMRLAKNDCGIGETPGWDGLTLEDYEERDITDSMVSLHMSHLYTMYCCTGESRPGRNASKSMSLIAYSSVGDVPQQSGVVVKAYCVNDYSKSTVNSVSSEDNPSSSTFLAVVGDGEDVLVGITLHTNEANTQHSDRLDLAQKRLSFGDIWHDNGPSCNFVVTGEPCDMTLHQESHESHIHHLGIRPLSLTRT